MCTHESVYDWNVELVTRARGISCRALFVILSSFRLYSFGDLLP